MDRESLARLICESLDNHAKGGWVSWVDEDDVLAGSEPFGTVGIDYSAGVDMLAVADDVLAAMKEA